MDVALESINKKTGKEGGWGLVIVIDYHGMTNSCGLLAVCTAVTAKRSRFESLLSVFIPGEYVSRTQTFVRLSRAVLSFRVTLVENNSPGVTQCERSRVCAAP